MLRILYAQRHCHSKVQFVGPVVRVYATFRIESPYK